jgi:hypothetical protein
MREGIGYVTETRLIQITLIAFLAFRLGRVVDYGARSLSVGEALFCVISAAHFLMEGGGE